MNASLLNRKWPYLPSEAHSGAKGLGEFSERMEQRRLVLQKQPENVSQLAKKRRTA